MTTAQKGLKDHTSSEQIADFAVQVQLANVPPEVVQRACDLILDATGCALASLGQDFARQTFRSVSSLAGQGARGVVGHTQRLPMRDAALLNGLLMHGLAFDDTHTAGVVHLTVSLLPTVLAVGCQIGATGAAILEAYVAGLEVGARLATAAQGGFHRQGWHPTSLVGTIASAVAAGRLLKLDRAQLVDVQGIALSMAGGSLQFLADGSWTKRLHPGWAAQAGITAAWLAAGGFPAPRESLDGRHGLFGLHLSDPAPALANLQTLLQGLSPQGQATPWELMRVAIKPYPICHLLHGATEAAIQLHRQGVDMTAVEAIAVRIPQDIVPVVCEPVAAKRKPTTDYEAKFSLPHAVATGLLRGRLGLAELEPAALNATDVQRVMQLVNYEIDTESTYPRHYSGEVTARLRGGQQVSARVPVNLGHDERPLSRADIENKFHAHAANVLPPAHAQALQNAIQGLPTAAHLAALEDLLTFSPSQNL